MKIITILLNIFSRRHCKHQQSAYTVNIDDAVSEQYYGNCFNSEKVGGKLVVSKKV